MFVLVLDQILNTVFHKGKFWVHYFLIMIDLFYECEENDMANYADDINPYSCGTDIPTANSELQDISTKIFNWFANNHIKATPG